MENTIEARMLRLLKHVAVEVRPCKLCGATLYFLPLNTGKVAPYTADGENHFANCPHASQFRKRGRPAQRPLIETAPVPD